MPSPRDLLDRLLAALRRAFDDASPDEGDVVAPDPPPSHPFELPADLTGPSRRSRRCYSRKEIHAARRKHGKARGPVPRSMPCPSREELVELGLFEPTPRPSMSGTSLVDGPFRIERQCCYELLFWSTGRPLLVGGVARRSPLVRAAARPSAAAWQRTARGSRPGSASSLREQRSPPSPPGPGRAAPRP